MSGKYLTNSTSIPGLKQYHVEVQIIILKIGQIDTKNETFYAEFFIESSWTEKLTGQTIKRFIYDPKKHFNPNIVLNNSIGEPLQEISYNSKKNSSNVIQVFERRKVQGRFWQKFDFKYFPMDVQTLNIELSSSNPYQQVLLVESKEKFNFLNPNAFMDSQEWNLYNVISSKESVCSSDISEDQYSSFSISINASRIPYYYFYNAFLLIFLITTIGLGRFTVSCDTPQVRLILDTSVVLTLITFKWVISEDIPQISYLTSLDKYTLFSIIFISSQCIYDSIIGSLTAPKCVKPHGFYDLIAFIVSASVIVLANLILLGWVLFSAFRNKYNVYKQSKMSNNLNSKRLFKIYNKDMNSFDNGSKFNKDNDSDSGSGSNELEEYDNNVNLDENDQQEGSNKDSDSVLSQTIKL